MLKVAIDESGSHEAPAIVVVACFATSTQWNHFRREWTPRACKYSGEFHSADASDSDLDYLTSLLTRRLGGLATTIDYADFRDVVPEWIKSRFGAEYSTGIQAIALVLRHFCTKHGIRWMNWVLEAGHQGQASAELYLQKIVGNQDWHIRRHSWVGKEEVITHAPDLVAHEIGACYNREPSQRLKEIYRSVAYRPFSREELAEAVKRVTPLMTAERREKELQRARRKRKKS
jgi:hypothetical protein